MSPPTVETLTVTLTAHEAREVLDALTWNRVSAASTVRALHWGRDEDRILHLDACHRVYQRLLGRLQRGETTAETVSFAPRMVLRPDCTALIPGAYTGGRDVVLSRADIELLAAMLARA